MFSGTGTSKESSEDKLEAPELRFVYGPRMFFPAIGEVVHTFYWKVPSPLVDQTLVNDERAPFQVLSTSRTFFWKTNVILLSSDSHYVPVKLSITYQIASVEKCVQAQDPFHSLEPALLHDANRCSLTEASIRKSDLSASSFPSFCEAMTNVGFRLLNIQVLGTMESIESKMAAENLAQKETERTMDQLVQETKTVNSQKLEFLKGLQDLGVDLTQVLVASVGKVHFDVERCARATNYLCQEDVTAV